MRSLLRKSVGRLSGEGASKGPGFTPEYSKLLICDNGQDNVPETFVEGDAPDETVYFISQSRSPGHKNVGQDSMGIARHGDYTVNVLCDGHDRDGHDVSRAVCRVLPNIIMRRIFSREDVSRPVSSELLIESFRETADQECWTSEGIQAGMFVKCFGGKWNQKVGFVHEWRNDSAAVLIVVDEEGYHRPLVERKYLRRAKFTGGCTVVAVVRNLATGQCRVAQAGDSRVLLMQSNAFEDPFFKPVFGVTSFTDNSVPPMGMTTPAHNVFNKDELLRLNTDYSGAFEIDGAFLVNPVTKFSIQPTRGIGDFDVYGTGYIDVPEVSKSFLLRPGVVLFVASDGIFDDHVFRDDELVTFFSEHLSPTAPLLKVATMLYDETLQRSLAGGYVDDISFFLLTANECREPAAAGTVGSSEPSETAESLDSEDLAAADEALDEKDEAKAEAKPARKSLLGGLMKKSKKKKSRREEVSLDDERITTKPDIEAPAPEDRRKTIDRKDRGSFTDLLQQALAAQADDEEGGADDADADAPTTPRASGADDELAGIVLDRFASRYGHSPETVQVGKEVSAAAAKLARRVSAALTKRSTPANEDDGEEE